MGPHWAQMGRRGARISPPRVLSFCGAVLCCAVLLGGLATTGAFWYAEKMQALFVEVDLSHAKYSKYTTSIPKYLGKMFPYWLICSRMQCCSPTLQRLPFTTLMALSLHMRVYSVPRRPVSRLNTHLMVST